MKLAEQIRKYAREELIKPARAANEGQLSLRAGDIHLALDLKNRMPAVCGALDAQKFYTEAKVSLISRTGPHQGANAKWVLRL